MRRNNTEMTSDIETIQAIDELIEEYKTNMAVYEEAKKHNARECMKKSKKS